MSPVFVVLGLAVLLRAVGAGGVSELSGWLTCSRWATGSTFVVMGVAHFTPLRRDVLQFVPDGVRNPGALVSLLGLWQLLGGIALLTEGTRQMGALALVVLLVLKLPANVRAARLSLRQRGAFATSPKWRVPAQLGWIALVIWVGR